MNNPTYNTQLETIKNNALKDIEEYVGIDGMPFGEYKVYRDFYQRLRIAYADKNLGPLAKDWNCVVICSIADYINYINDK